MSRSTTTIPTTAPVQRNWIGWALAYFNTIAFSITTPIGRAAAVAGVNPTMLLAWRFLVGTTLLVLTLRLTAPQKLRIERSKLPLIVAASIAACISVLSYYWALTRVSGSIAAMAVSIYPLLILLLLALRGEKFTYRNGLRVAFGLGGVYLLVGPGGRVDPIGIALVLLAAVAYAVHVVLIQWFLREVESSTIALYVLISMTVVLLGIWLATGAEGDLTSGAAWSAILALSLVPTFLAALALYAAMQRIGGGEMALLAPLETLLAVAWSVLFLGERLSSAQLGGMLLILASMALAVQRLRRVRPRIRLRRPTRT